MLSQVISTGQQCHKIEEFEKLLLEKQELLSKIEEKETEIDNKINELLDCWKLNQKTNEVENKIRELRIATILESISRSFSTDPLSRKTTQARKALIAENFINIFYDELKSLRRGKIKVNLNFRTDKGKSFILQDIGSNYALSDILSEGEQKAIALAEFLTELQLHKSKAPVVFDDPVTSLDHKIIDEVANRLIKLSSDRQVIVFTHSILLFNSVLQKSELDQFRGLNFKYYEVQTDLENTGILYESPTLREDSFNNYKTEINRILNLPKGERGNKENELAIRGYDKLRAAIEIFVEKEIFQNTVRRYRKNVAMTGLNKIKGNLIEKHKEEINMIFERCCDYVGAHSKADGLNYEPSLSELQNDLNKLIDIRSEFL